MIFQDQYIAKGATSIRKVLVPPTPSRLMHMQANKQHQWKVCVSYNHV